MGAASVGQLRCFLGPAVGAAASACHAAKVVVGIWYVWSTHPSRRSQERRRRPPCKAGNKAPRGVLVVRGACWLLVNWRAKRTDLPFLMYGVRRDIMMVQCAGF